MTPDFSDTMMNEKIALGYCNKFVSKFQKPLTRGALVVLEIFIQYYIKIFRGKLSKKIYSNCIGPETWLLWTTFHFLGNNLNRTGMTYFSWIKVKPPCFSNFSNFSKNIKALILYISDFYFLSIVRVLANFFEDSTICILDLNMLAFGHS